ncbi:MAG: hypothetical protein BWY24_00354 [Microgenomates group bacterium ADurb.Bin219]|nr:MAG: hypothetical protein BWY24_00354 [Microgenomates group bacterium ADurb.Bin219]
MPSFSSLVKPKPLPSSTVTTPSLPTLLKASAIILPISGSAAEIVATWAISSLPLIGLAILSISSLTNLTPFSIPLFKTIGLAPAVIFFKPLEAIA